MICGFAALTESAILTDAKQTLLLIFVTLFCLHSNISQPMAQTNWSELTQVNYRQRSSKKIVAIHICSQICYIYYWHLQPANGKSTPDSPSTSPVTSWEVVVPAACPSRVRLLTTHLAATSMPSMLPIIKEAKWTPIHHATFSLQLVARWASIHYHCLYCNIYPFFQIVLKLFTIQPT